MEFAITAVITLLCCAPAMTYQIRWSSRHTDACKSSTQSVIQVSSLLGLLVELVVFGEAMPRLIEGREPVIIRSALHLHQRGQITFSAALR